MDVGSPGRKSAYHPTVRTVMCTRKWPHAHLFLVRSSSTANTAAGSDRVDVTHSRRQGEVAVHVEHAHLQRSLRSLRCHAPKMLGECGASRCNRCGGTRQQCRIILRGADEAGLPHVRRADDRKNTAARAPALFELLTSGLHGYRQTAPAPRQRAPLRGVASTGEVCRGVHWPVGGWLALVARSEAD